VYNVFSRISTVFNQQIHNYFLVNILKTVTKFAYHQVQHLKILHIDNIRFMSSQNKTASCATYSINDWFL